MIAPALNRGAWVLCDRFTDSTIAYQGAGKGVDRALIDELARKVQPHLRPDLTLVFDADFQVSSKRLAAAGRPLDRFESEGRGFFDRVRGAYLDLAQREPERVQIINGGEALDKVKARIEEIISSI